MATLHYSTFDEAVAESEALQKADPEAWEELMEEQRAWQPHVFRSLPVEDWDEYTESEDRSEN